MGMTKIVPALAAALLLTACGAAEVAGEQPPAPSAPDPTALYSANAMVLEDKTHGPMLCLGVVLESLPPQCGDVPIAGWNWEKVGGEEKAGGATWGTYHVVGRYDGETFAVTDVGPSDKGASGSETEPDFASPCEEPAGGWSGLDHATQNDDGAVHEYARSQPEYVTSWVTQLDREALEFSPVIVNVVFTGDAERHEAEIRKAWDGPLCVVERDVPSADELSRIRKEAESSLDELGLQMLWSDGPSVEPVIEIGVVVDVAGRGQAAFDARYGAGVVRLVPALKPAS
jgi:hypothetical protein